MSVLQQIRDLEEQKKALLKKAHDEALKKAHDAIAELKELGFDYSVQSAANAPTARRSGIRQAVLAVIKDKRLISRSDIIEALNAKGDKRAEQSISNALSNLKKAGTIDNLDGLYTPTTGSQPDKS